MSFTISSSTPFSSINWNDFENRPPIDASMMFCEDGNRSSESKCCMETDAIDSVRRVAHKNNLWEEEEVKFLEEYPCINWAELDSIADKIDEMIPTPESAIQEVKQTPLGALFDHLKKLVCSK